MKRSLVIIAILFSSPYLRIGERIFAADVPAAAADTPAATLPSHGKADHVLLVVWDGMRPDLIREDTTPTLAKLARTGTFFAKHHSVYPTSTEVNGTALATGCFPAHSGIVGNREYRPDIDPTKPVDTQDLTTIRRGDELTGGKYLAVPTLPEMLQRSGMRTVVAGTKPVAWLMDRAVRTATGAGSPLSASIVDGESLPSEAAEAAAAIQGAFLPAKQLILPNTANDAWTRQALVNILWRDGLPKFSVLWLSEPDYSQHEFGIGSSVGLRALASSDQQLAEVLAALDKNGWRETTDIIVVSDHGFSTISQPVDIARDLKAAGFSTHLEYAAPPKAGSILVNNLGGTVFLYIAAHEAETISRVTDFLQSTAYSGTIFTRLGLPGTFPLSAVNLDSSQAPDVVVSMRWNDEKNSAGLPGSVLSNGARKSGQGSHASMSRFDVHNTCVAAGPDFRAGFTSELPSSNLDVAPTAAWILGCAPASPFDGRILKESLVLFSESAPPAPPKSERQMASHNLGAGSWEQYLQVTYFGGETYLDEANGSLTGVRP